MQPLNVTVSDDAAREGMAIAFSEYMRDAVRFRELRSSLEHYFEEHSLSFGTISDGRFFIEVLPTSDEFDPVFASQSYTACVEWGLNYINHPNEQSQIVTTARKAARDYLQTFFAEAGTS